MLHDEVVDAASTEPAPRRPAFRMPNIRADIRALPSIFRSKPILFVPLVLLLVGLPLYILIAQGRLSPDISGLAGYYVQFFFLPPALFTFFIAGFFAPRASYLVGFIYGLIAGVIWTSGFLIVGVPAQDSGQTATPLVLDPPLVLMNMLVVGVLYGTLAAALAAWYRDFLRGIQERGRARRAASEMNERAKRRDQRQEARRVAKQRPTT
jgi:hypothetical protein